MEQLVAVVSVNGRIPRRAVLLEHGSSIADRASHPDLPECELVSRVCELARAASNAPVYPRHTSELIGMCLATNAPGAWQAAHDDLATGDLDLDAAVSVIRQSSNGSVLIACIVSSREATHLLHASCLLAAMLSRLDEETRTEMGRALSCQLKALVETLVLHGALLSRDVRDAMLTGFGRMLATVGVADAVAADTVVYALAHKRDELLRLFLGVTPAFLDHRPQILPMLVDRCRAAPRHPSVTLLARLVAQCPSILAGHERHVQTIVCAMLSAEELDCREAMAAAALAQAADGCGDRMASSLASALHRCCASLLAKCQV